MIYKAILKTQSENTIVDLTKTNADEAAQELFIYMATNHLSPEKQVVSAQLLEINKVHNVDITQLNTLFTETNKVLEAQELEDYKRLKAKFEQQQQ